MRTELASFEDYQRTIAQLNHQSIEQEGIPDPDAYMCATNDPCTVYMPNEAGQLVPVLTPVSALTSYVNTAFYRLLPGMRDGPLYHYLHLPHIQATQGEDYVTALAPTMRRLAAESGALVYDFPQARREVDGQVRELLQSIGGIASRHLIDPRCNLPRHYHYVSRAELIAADAVAAQPLNFYDLSKQHPNRRVEVLATLGEADIEHVWSYYDPVHGRLNAADPVAAGFHEGDFRLICQSPDFVKLACRAGDGNIVHMILVATVQQCPWLNRELLKARFPQEYCAGRIICGIGAITQPDHPRGYSYSLATLGEVHRLVALAGGDAIYVGAFDEESVHTARPLTQLSTRGTDIRINFERAVGHQVFRARQLSVR